jgi:anti-sigma regulatory factor (Ser/Thr protein kinase)
MSSSAKPAAERSFEPHSSQIRAASEWLNDVGAALHIPLGALNRLNVCLNEAMANVLDHGGEGGHAAPLRLFISVEILQPTSGTATLTLCDSGKQFDPTTFTPAPLPKSLDDALPGGLGIILIRGNANTVTYSYRDGCNQLAMTVGWQES